MKKSFITVLLLVLIALVTLPAGLAGTWTQGVNGLNIYLFENWNLTFQAPYLYNILDVVYFNESYLNQTIDARTAASQGKNASGPYLYNDSATIYFNETVLNNTIDARTGGAIGVNETGGWYNSSSTTHTNLSVNISGSLRVDNNTFYVDNVTNRVGIGTISPGALLTLQDGTSRIYFNNIAGALYYFMGADAPGSQHVGYYVGNNLQQRFYVGGTRRMTIDANGTGFGAEANIPTYLLQVGHNALVPGRDVNLSDTLYLNGTSKYIQINGDVNVTGTVFADNVSSSSPLNLQNHGITKVNIEDIINITESNLSIMGTKPGENGNLIVNGRMAIGQNHTDPNYDLIINRSDYGNTRMIIGSSNADAFKLVGGTGSNFMNQTRLTMNGGTPTSGVLGILLDNPQYPIEVNGNSAAGGVWVEDSTTNPSIFSAFVAQTKNAAATAKYVLTHWDGSTLTWALRATNINHTTHTANLDIFHWPGTDIATFNWNGTTNVHGLLTAEDGLRVISSPTSSIDFYNGFFYLNNTGITEISDVRVKNTLDVAAGSVHLDSSYSNISNLWSSNARMLRIENNQNSSLALDIMNGNDSSGALSQIALYNDGADQFSCFLTSTTFEFMGFPAPSTAICSADAANAFLIESVSSDMLFNTYDSDNEILTLGNYDAKFMTNLFSVNNVTDDEYALQVNTTEYTVNIRDVLHLEPRAAAPSSPTLGDLYVDSGTDEICFYNSTHWVGLSTDIICS